MAKCTKIKREIKRVCAGSLNRLITVNVRSITPPTGGSVDFGEELTEPKNVWAMVKTINGTTIFDDTNTEKVITHDIYIRYTATITPEKWVKLPSVTGGNDVLLDIVRVDNLNEDNRFYRLRCNLRGNTAVPVNLA